jgi:hypothetical protein
MNLPFAVQILSFGVFLRHLFTISSCRIPDRPERDPYLPRDINLRFSSGVFQSARELMQTTCPRLRLGRILRSPWYGT